MPRTQIEAVKNPSRARQTILGARGMRHRVALLGEGSQCRTSSATLPGSEGRSKSSTGFSG